MPIAWAMGFSFITPTNRALDKELWKHRYTEFSWMHSSRAYCIQSMIVTYKLVEGKHCFLPSCNVVQLCGERGKYNTVWNTRPWEQMSTKCYSLLTELPVDFKKQRLLTRLHGLQAPRADDGESEMGEAHRKRCGAWGGIWSGRHFWKIHLTAAGGAGWEWEHQV